MSGCRFACRSAASVGRLVVLVVLLVGFTAMHGLAATSGDGTHHSPLALPAVSDAHGIDALSMVVTTNIVVRNADHLTGHRTAGGVGAAEAMSTATGEHGGSGGGEDPHAALAGCVIALYGLAVLALVLPGRGTLTRGVRELAALRHCPDAVRLGHPPPRQPPRISLCILRV